MSTTGKLLYHTADGSYIKLVVPAVRENLAFNNAATVFRGTNAKLLKKFIESMDKGTPLFESAATTQWGSRGPKRARYSNVDGKKTMEEILQFVRMKYVHQ